MKEDLRYTPADKERIDNKGAIRLMCAPFRSHEDGLPEWLKNSCDEYVRREFPQDRRKIFLILKDSKKALGTASISCLDFSGMQSDVIENHFAHWASAEASTQGGVRGENLQGGHGNGGKCYMTQMFNEFAYIHTARDGKGCRFGVQAGKVNFGYMPNEAEGKGYPVSDVWSELDRALHPVDLRSSVIREKLPEYGGWVSGFTLVRGIDPKEFSGKIPAKRIAEELLDHSQMIVTLEICDVYIIWNGEYLNDGRPYSLPEIQSIEGYEQPRKWPIPLKLKSPKTGERVSTTADGKLPEGQLILRTSNKQLNMSKRRSRHGIVFRAKGEFIGSVSMATLDVQSTFRNRMYGEVHLDSLWDYKTNERGEPANSTLTEAVYAFVSRAIQEYCKEFEERDKAHYDKKEKEEISRINEALDRWKNQFLRDQLSGFGGPGGDSKTPRSLLPVGRPSRIELKLTHSRSGLGVALRPLIQFFDQNNVRIRPVPFRWISEDNNVALVDEDLGVISTFSYGRTEIYAETIKGDLRSNRQFLEVVRIQEIRVVPEEIEIEVGGRGGFEAECTLPSGEIARDVLLQWCENNDEIARCSTSGRVFGINVGETYVKAMDESKESNAGIVHVIPAGTGGPGDAKGRGFPKILVSEVDPDPDTGKIRTFPSDSAPVCQDAIDTTRNIWWINSAAPLARLYLNKDLRYGSSTPAWRMYHLERFIEVIAQMLLIFEEDGQLTVNDMLFKWGAKVAEIQAMVVSELSGFIRDGELPTVN